MYTDGEGQPVGDLIFHLTNGSNHSIDSAPGTWTLVIDGKDVADSGMIFGNGPAPIGGFGTLKPGAAYEFEKGLPLVQYFPENRDYKVLWRGSQFRSNRVTVHGIVHTQ